MFSNLECLLFISGISGFCFLPQSILENTETMENFDNLIFWSDKTIDLTFSSFERILCVSNNLFANKKIFNWVTEIKINKKVVNRANENIENIKITFAVGRITQYMPIKLVFTLWSLNKGETRCSKLKYIEENEDAYS